jgi:hypothetical protein
LRQVQTGAIQWARRYEPSGVSAEKSPANGSNPNLDLEVALPRAASVFYFPQAPQISELLNMRNVVLNLQKMVLFPD